MRKTLLMVPLFSVWVVTALADNPSKPDSSNVSHVEKMVGNWDVDCSKEVCLVMLYYNNGAGDTTTVVKVDKATLKPENFAFMIAGSVDQDKGFVAQFVKTLIDEKNPKCAGGPDTPRPAECYHKQRLEDEVFNGPFTSCDDKGCFARMPGQYIGDEGTPGRIDLLEQYETEDDVLLLWKDKNDKLQSVMLEVYGFKKAYDAALDILSEK